MRRQAFPRLVLVALAGGALSAFSPGAGDRPTPKPHEVAKGEELFLRQIQPLLKTKCLGCHGEGDDKPSGKLDLRTREAMLKGGNSGPAVVPGDAAKSLLYQAVSGAGDLVMPPKKEGKLSREEVAALRAWLDAGAPWARPRPVATKQYDPKDTWAFRPVQRHPVPAAGSDPSLTKTPVDHFILQKLADKGLSPAPPADRRTLLRRVTFDLTGLPPTPEEVAAALSDPSPDWYEKVVDRLLASPRYGEQWGRHWLDVVRYADTSGYSNDYERPNAWRYRDYVVRAFNQDRPFDRFVLEQLAGDEIDPENPELLVAAGYLRLGPWEHTGMSVAAVTRQMFLDDVTNAVGTTFLALPLSCCRCHDHKFDPLPTRDYYRVQAVFAPAQFEERPAPFLPSENTAGFAEGLARVKERIRLNEARLKEIQAKADRAVQELLKKHNAKDVSELPKELRPDKQYGLDAADGERQRVYRKRLEYYQRELQRYEPQAFSVSSGGLKKPIPTPDVHVLVGGALDAPADKVTPGVLSAVHGSDDAANPTAWNTVPTTTAGRRLAFAKWVASADNPLTARVFVNRVWQYHFGKGLVETSNAFGKMGKRPTHPELLDWLAGYFVEQGWSTKALHRLILRSAVYRQGGEHPDMRKVREADPQNQFLAYFPPRRLTAEELRDGVLAVTGELSGTAGGPGTFPEINRDVALQPRQIMGTVAPIYEPSAKREQRNRRTICTFQMRTLADPFVEVFNGANPDVSCERREESTVTPQVFALFNSQFLHDRALALAARLEKQDDTPAGRIDALFRLAFGRPPSQRERAACLKHYEKMLGHHRRTPPVKEELPKQIVRTHIAELTGTRFDFVEDWDLASYEPDLKPWDVPAATRALAEVCLVVLNSNEFVYVY